MAAIAAIVIMAVSSFGTNLNMLNGLLNVGLQSKSTVNQSLQIMENEIRSAQPAQNGAFEIDSATTSSFAFYADPDQDGVTEHLRYFLSSSSIMRGIIQPTGTPATYPTSGEIITDVIDGVSVTSTSTPLFTYYDANYTGTQSPLATPVNINQVRLIGINFKVSVKASSSPTSTTSYSTMVDIRNLRSN